MFETLYLEGDSLGGRVAGEPDAVRVHLDDVESLYTREIDWLSIMWTTVGILVLLDYIAFRASS